MFTILYTVCTKPIFVLYYGYMTIKDKTKIIERYLGGEDAKDIAKDFKISTREVTSICTNNPITRTEIEKKVFEVDVARESVRVQQIKDDIYTYIHTTVQEGLTKDNKEGFMETILSMLNQLDKIGRLNREKPTNIEETNSKSIHLDVAKTLKELKSPEDRRAFLLRNFKTP